MNSNDLCVTRNGADNNLVTVEKEENICYSNDILAFWSERAKEKVEIRARDRMEVKEG